jgi:hypothetical protein
MNTFDRPFRFLALRGCARNTARKMRAMAGGVLARCGSRCGMLTSSRRGVVPALAAIVNAWEAHTANTNAHALAIRDI